MDSTTPLLPYLIVCCYCIQKNTVYFLIRLTTEQLGANLAPNFYLHNI